MINVARVFNPWLEHGLETHATKTSSRGIMRYSPGDLSVAIPEVYNSHIEAAILRADEGFADWRTKSIDERAAKMKRAQAHLESAKDHLAEGIARETGKPLKEALGEMGAVIAKCDLAVADAKRYLAEVVENDNPHPNIVRRRPRGVAAVIGPFNFPIHLAHGAITAYLMAGNTVVFKPSPLAANVCNTYGQIMRGAFPGSVFEIVQGGAEQGQQLVGHRKVKSVCFTGSVPAGKAIARATAEHFYKDVALEMGGKNAAIIHSDADLDLAATAVADAICLTAGQRCNSTSRVLVNNHVAADFIARLQQKLAEYVPGDPLLETTRLGALVSPEAKSRYLETIRQPYEWLIPGDAPTTVDGKKGHYVTPAVAKIDSDDALTSPLFLEEVFAPVLAIVPCTEREMIPLANGTEYGLTTSIFTADRERFLAMADHMETGNVYQNLPSTFSPSTLPFGGWKNSGNRHPGGRGFVRFVTDEQAVQMKA